MSASLLRSQGVIATRQISRRAFSSCPSRASAYTRTGAQPWIVGEALGTQPAGAPGYYFIRIAKGVAAVTILTILAKGIIADREYRKENPTSTFGSAVNGKHDS